METTLHRSLIVALSTVALAIILRNAPIVRGWVQEMKKPWACNVCLPLYLCALCTAGLYFYSPSDWTIVYAYLPGYAMSYLILEYIGLPKTPFIPPALVELDDTDEPDHLSEVTPVRRYGSSGPPPLPTTQRI